MNPADRYYTKEHEWIKIEEPGIGIIGITDHAQCELGDVVYVELPETGATISSMEKMGEIESVKAVSDLFSPVTAEVIEQNDEILTSPEKVNEDPFGSGWLVKVKLTDESELQGLMDSEAYTSLTS
ncbi:MAG: glycine cleavage system protein GcvH [SAR202 cluster bacterium]|mgnify:FL=1|nr:glycine cleavage system protein GcvH [Dehalococcoidia bacterium]MQG08154.1 glycine cleavage system protein GcvH [SAR202 cluster bacterium]CAI8320682.1 MAG: Glycine cleavage system H protein [Chloroflexota bacterium]MQG17900.1 glycine cleavage system protein GcvH [SAR202 cluster bacterium]MQG26660.1 glycine cleavage system protein GcvH [SAR202 cluster bacterium]